jgi:predicted Zn-dependent protease with MMP-like domain
MKIENGMFRGQDLSLSSHKNISATPNRLVTTGKAILNLCDSHGCKLIDDHLKEICWGLSGLCVKVYGLVLVV